MLYMYERARSVRLRSRQKFSNAALSTKTFCYVIISTFCWLMDVVRCLVCDTVILSMWYCDTLTWHALPFNFNNICRPMCVHSFEQIKFTVCNYRIQCGLWRLCGLVGQPVQLVQSAKENISRSSPPINAVNRIVHAYLFSSINVSRR